MALPLIPILVAVGLAALAAASSGSKTAAAQAANYLYQNHLYQLTIRFSAVNPLGGAALATRLAQIGWTDIVVQPMKGQDPYVFYVMARWAAPTGLCNDTTDVKFLGFGDQTPHIQYDAGMPENIRLAVQTALETETDPARLRSFGGSLLPEYPASAEALKNKALILEAMSGQTDASAPPGVPPAPPATPVTTPLPSNTLPPVPPVFSPPIISTPALPSTTSNPVGGIDLSNINLGQVLSQIGNTLGGLPASPIMPAAPVAPSAPVTPGRSPYPGMAASIPAGGKVRTTDHSAGQTNLKKFFTSHSVVDPGTGAPFVASSIAIDGVIGPVTQKATWIFQNWWNTVRVPSTGEAKLTTDGLFGTNTYAALKKV